MKEDLHSLVTPSQIVLLVTFVTLLDRFVLYGEHFGKEDVNITRSTEECQRSIRVEGGDDGKTVSEFNGPVIFKDKISSSSMRVLNLSHLT